MHHPGLPTPPYFRRRSDRPTPVPPSPSRACARTPCRAPHTFSLASVPPNTEQARAGPPPPPPPPPPFTCTHSDYAINEADGPTVRRQLTDILAPLTPRYLTYALVFRRPLIRLPVWKDLPRLVKGVVVFAADRRTGTETPLFSYTAGMSVAQAICALLPVLAAHTDGAAAAEALAAPLATHLGCDFGVSGDLAAAVQALLTTVDPEAVKHARPGPGTPGRLGGAPGPARSECHPPPRLAHAAAAAQTRTHKNSLGIALAPRSHPSARLDVSRLLDVCCGQGWVGLLKTIHQEMLAPAVIDLRTKLMDAPPFKDQRGAWRVAVALSDESITVTHLKGEVAMSPAAEATFQFDWSLALRLDREAARLLDAQVAVLSYTFGPKAGMATIEAVGAALRPLMADGGPFPYAQLWHSVLLTPPPPPAIGGSGEVSEAGALSLRATARGRMRRGSMLEDAQGLLDSVPEADLGAAEREPDPEELTWLKTEWSAVALRHQLRHLSTLLGEEAAPPPPCPAPTPTVDVADAPAAADAPSEAVALAEASTPPEATAPLAEKLWDAMKRTGMSFAEVRRLDVLPLAASGAAPSKDDQAACWLECVTGVPLGGTALRSALSSGERLCDLINAIKPGLIPRVTRAAACAGMSATRLAAKQRDNITRYLESCTFLGVRPSDLFTTVDLFDSKNLDAVIKNILALSQLAVDQLAEFHGPTLAVGKGTVWVQPPSWVKRGSSVSLMGVSSDSIGAAEDGAPSDAPSASSRGDSRGDSGALAARFSARRASGGTDEEARLEGRATIDVSGKDEGEAARAWIEGVLEVELGERTLQEALSSGVLLCQLVNAVKPGILARINEKDTPFSHMENIGNYTKACERLRVTPTFDTIDLYEAKNMRVVAQNLHALARTARTLESYQGPLLSAQLERMQL